MQFHKSLLLIAILAFSLNTNASEFYDNYTKGNFKEAFYSFKYELKKKNKNLNHEALLDTMLSIYPQLKGVKINELRSQLSELSKLPIKIFLRKRLKSDLAELKLYQKLKNGSIDNIEKEIDNAKKIKGQPLKYNHKKKSKLRIIKMAILNRKSNKVATPGDDYLYALAEYEISKGGKQFLEDYFKKADSKDKYYAKAIELKKKLDIPIKYR